MCSLSPLWQSSHNVYLFVCVCAYTKPSHCTLSIHTITLVNYSSIKCERGCDKVLQREGKEKHELSGVPPGARHAVPERVVEGERESQGRLWPGGVILE